MYHKTIIEFGFRMISCLTSLDKFLISFVSSNRFDFLSFYASTPFFCKNVNFSG